MSENIPQEHLWQPGQDIYTELDTPEDLYTINPEGQHTRKWWPADTEEGYKKNLKNKRARRELERFGWIENPEIEYSFNSHGFRCDEFDFDCEDNIIFLGCSYTAGVGLPIESTYVTAVANHFNGRVVNLAAPGKGIDTMYRYAKHFIPQFKSKIVIAMESPGPRYEVFCSSMKDQTAGIQNNQLGTALTRYRYMVDYNINVHLDKSYHAINDICKVNNTQFMGF